MYKQDMKVDRGWSQMETLLTQEMPINDNRRYKRVMWLLLSGVSMLGLSFMIWVTLSTDSNKTQYPKPSPMLESVPMVADYQGHSVNGLVNSIPEPKMSLDNISLQSKASRKLTEPTNNLKKISHHGSVFAKSDVLVSNKFKLANFDNAPLNNSADSFLGVVQDHLDPHDSNGAIVLEQLPQSSTMSLENKRAMPTLDDLEFTQSKSANKKPIIKIAIIGDYNLKSARRSGLLRVGSPVALSEKFEIKPSMSLTTLFDEKFQWLESDDAFEIDTENIGLIEHSTSNFDQRPFTSKESIRVWELAFGLQVGYSVSDKLRLSPGVIASYRLDSPPSIADVDGNQYNSISRWDFALGLEASYELSRHLSISAGYQHRNTLRYDRGLASLRIGVEYTI